MIRICIYKRHGNRRRYYEDTGNTLADVTTVLETERNGEGGFARVELPLDTIEALARFVRTRRGLPRGLTVAQAVDLALSAAHDAVDPEGEAVRRIPA